jgi:hypothetical protein
MSWTVRATGGFSLPCEPAYATSSRVSGVYLKITRKGRENIPLAIRGRTPPMCSGRDVLPIKGQMRGSQR